MFFPKSIWKFNSIDQIHAVKSYFNHVFETLWIIHHLFYFITWRLFFYCKVHSSTLQPINNSWSHKKIWIFLYVFVFFLTQNNLPNLKLLLYRDSFEVFASFFWVWASKVLKCKMVCAYDLHINHRIPLAAPTRDIRTGYTHVIHQ